MCSSLISIAHLKETKYIGGDIVALINVIFPPKYKFYLLHEDSFFSNSLQQDNDLGFTSASIKYTPKKKSNNDLGFNLSN